MKCVCETTSHFNSGYKGILARVEEGKIKSKVERCDVCGTFPTDAFAKQILLRLLKAELHQVTILVEARDIRKQLKELEKYLNQNSGHLELPRLKAFENTQVLLTSIKMDLEGNHAKSTRKAH